MDAGQVGEYGSPKELLKDPKSLFSQLIAAEQAQERDGGFGSSKTETVKKVIVNEIKVEKEKVEASSGSGNATGSDPVIALKSVEYIMDSTETMDSKRTAKVIR